MEASLKQQFYDEYVSSGQAGLDAAPSTPRIVGSGRPYLQRVIQRFIPGDRQIRILDLGCGHGVLLSLLKEHGYHNIAGVDASPEQVAAANRSGLREIELGGMQEFLEQQHEPADVIVMFDVLEHLDLIELRLLVQTVFQKLTPTGRAIIHIPNGEGLFGQRIRYGDLTHETCFTPKSIRQLLIPVGFQRIWCIEDKPIPHGVVSTIRRLIWDVGTIWPRLLLMAETGERDCVLSQNMLVVADRGTRNRHIATSQ